VRRRLFVSLSAFYVTNIQSGLECANLSLMERFVTTLTVILITLDPYKSEHLEYQTLILSANEVKGLKQKYYNTMQPVRTGNDVEEPNPRLSTTSALGTMGTGINMAERKFVLINMGLYKPISAFYH